MLKEPNDKYICIKYYNPNSKSVCAIYGHREPHPWIQDICDMCRPHHIQAKEEVDGQIKKT